MIPQSFRSFFRMLMRNKTLSAINLSGLALGFSSCILIVLFLFDELNYDSHHANLDRIYRVTTKFISEGAVDNIAIAASPLPETLKEKYPEVEESIRFDFKGGGVTIRTNSQVYHDDNAFASDPGVFKIFSYKFLQGDPATALARPDNVVLTQSEAKKYFGNDNALGKTLTIDKHDHQVSAVIEDLPLNSEIRFSILLPLDTANRKDWFDFSYYVFVMFREKSIENPTLISDFQNKLQTLADENVNARIKKENINMSASLYIQPLKGLHFDNSLTYDTPKGNKNYVYIFVSVALLILFIACINYINFSIVQSMDKSREVGIRKVIGSTFIQLVLRYISQSLILTIAALILSIGLVVLLLPLFNDILGRNFSVMDLFQIEIVTVIIAIVLITGVLAGSYPAFYGSSVKIVEALKGNFGTPGGKAIRKVSITIQFAVTLGLLICTAIIYMQMNFVRSYDLGFRKDNVIAIRTPGDSAYYNAITAFKNELTQNNRLTKAVSIIGVGGMPGDPEDEQRGSQEVTNGEGKKEVRMINITYVDENYIDVLDIKLKEGRNYEAGSISDRENAIIVNEALAQAMRWKDPLSQTIRWREKDRKVIGVVGNIHYKSLYNPVQPQFFVPHQNQIINVIARLNSSDQKAISEIQQLWSKHFPGELFRYRFVDETIGKQYAQDQTVIKILTYFSIFTIAISLFGTFGLSLLSAYQRRKEIGIRKVIGANFKDITLLFCKEYLVFIILAFAVISPISWYLMGDWLAGFVNHTPIRIEIFITVAISFSVLALVSIILSIGKIVGRKSVELIK
jgi:putative ABC transport system permease protein